MESTCLTWDEVDYLWNDNPFTWDDVCLVIKATDGGHSSKYKDRLSDDEQKQFIKLVCKVKGIETYSGQKTIDTDIEVNVEDIKLVTKKVLGVDLIVENINV